MPCHFLNLWRPRSPLFSFQIRKTYSVWWYMVMVEFQTFFREFHYKEHGSRVRMWLIVEAIRTWRFGCGASKNEGVDQSWGEPPILWTPTNRYQTCGYSTAKHVAFRYQTRRFLGQEVWDDMGMETPHTIGDPTNALQAAMSAPQLILQQHQLPSGNLT